MPNNRPPSLSETPPVDPALRLSDFDYDLPEELIAQTPPTERDGGRLLLVERATGLLTDLTVRDLPTLLRAPDVIVVNNTRVLPARLQGKRATGGAVEILLLNRIGAGHWEALGKPGRKLQPGTGFALVSRDGADVREVRVLANHGEGRVEISFDPSIESVLDQFGETPLPPYIRDVLVDGERYQTVFSTVPGSAAAPTAGLHLSDRLLAELQDKGVERADVTLQIGLDTFRPVTVEQLTEHVMHSEWCSVPDDTAKAVAKARSEGGHVVAIGTTSARTLEHYGRLPECEREAAWSGWTDIFITPGYQWRMVDCLLTNFHLPKSTLLMMISSFTGRDLARAAYEHAIAERYRFFSFGDAMLIV